MESPRISVVIPALDEEASLPLVLAAIPREAVTEIVVADNGSTDRTAEVARAGGARVVSAPSRGYGSACLAGIAAADRPDVVLFLDGDFSDHPEEAPAVLAPILDGRADLCIGARVPERREPGAMLPQQIFGNWLATTLMRLLWGYRYLDLGPFRAIRADALERIRMEDRDYGWTVEMQIKALRAGLRVAQVPVSYRRRIGKSKIAGTIRGSVGAGVKILWTIFRYGLRR